MGEDGYICITDFGIAKDVAKKNSEMTSTFCGTFCYMSPEIVSNQIYSYEVDWWALGIITYEMIVGFPPFIVKNVSGPEPMFNLIMK